MHLLLLLTTLSPILRAIGIRAIIKSFTNTYLVFIIIIIVSFKNNFISINTNSIHLNLLEIHLLFTISNFGVSV